MLSPKPLASRHRNVSWTRFAPNFQQNIVVVSTPEEENATKYVRIRSILVAGRVHEVAAYRTAPYATCKGIIKDIARCDGPEVLHRKIVNSRNPLALAAKRIKDTGTVIVAFDGYRVPNYVRHGTPSQLEGGITVPDHDPGAAVVLRTPPNVTPKVVRKGDLPPRSVSSPGVAPDPGPRPKAASCVNSRRPPTTGAAPPGPIVCVEDRYR
ncbi:hypothetical protein MTO96_004596 [Rhipicephalus appendiculatus]